MDCWRLKQEANFERMAIDSQRDYSPVRCGLCDSLKGTATVGVVKGILLPYFGGVEESEDGERLVVPIVYGEEEVCSLKNVEHAVALQEVIYAHLAKGRTVYVDADYTIKTLELKDGYDKDGDGQNVREAQTRTAVEQGLAAWRRQVERGRVEDSDHDDIVDDHEDDAEPAREDNLDVDDGEEDDNVDDREENAIWFEEDDANVDDHEDNAVEFEEDDVNEEYDDAPLLPLGVRCDVGSVDDDNGLPLGLMPHMPLEEDNSSEEGSVDGSIGVDLDVLRERLGVSRSLRFGKFLESLPPVDSVVLVIHELHRDLAKVLEGYGDGSEDVLVQPMKIERLGVDIEVKVVE
ncbi:hypothetical protein FOZ62_019456, partial [Perkinsus olseni]